MADPMMDDDSDAPEEVTMNQGRDEAQTLRRKENENKKRLTEELKEKRQLQSEKRKKERVSGAGPNTDPKVNGNEVATLPERRRSRKRKGQESDSGEELEKKDLGSVMLDDTVVEFLRAREKQGAKGVGKAKHQYIEEEETKVKKTSKPDGAAPTNSRTQIVSLKARPNSTAANAALDFRRNHFFGSNVKRSTSMLPTTSKPFLASV